MVDCDSLLIDFLMVGGPYFFIYPFVELSDYHSLMAYRKRVEGVFRAEGAEFDDCTSGFFQTPRAGGIGGAGIFFSLGGIRKEKLY